MILSRALNIDAPHSAPVKGVMAAGHRPGPVGAEVRTAPIPLFRC